MVRRLLTFSVVLAASITISSTRITAQRSGAPPSGNQPRNSQRQPPKEPATRQQQPASDLRGTENAPLVVRVLPPEKTQNEPSQNQAKSNGQSDADWALVKLTGLLALIGAIQTVVFAVQAYRLKQTIDKMDSIAEAQTRDVQASIREANRAAVAMEQTAAAAIANTEAFRRNVELSESIAERQKLVSELSSRAYIAVSFYGAKYQDKDVRFEVEVQIANRGLTPAYDVTYKARTGIVPFPFPPDFDFPLTDADAGTSASLMITGAPPKTLSRVLPYRVPDEDVDKIRHPAETTSGRCLAMWGIVNYRDAFQKPRSTRWSFIVHWVQWVPGKELDSHGNPRPEEARSGDTGNHNSAD